MASTKERPSSEIKDCILQAAIAQHVISNYALVFVSVTHLRTRLADRELSTNERLPSDLSKKHARMSASAALFHHACTSPSLPRTSQTFGKPCSTRSPSSTLRQAGCVAFTSKLRSETLSFSLPSVSCKSSHLDVPHQVIATQWQ